MFVAQVAIERQGAWRDNGEIVMKAEDSYVRFTPSKADVKRCPTYVRSKHHNGHCELASFS